MTIAIKFSAALFLLLALIGCSEEKWTSFVYPNIKTMEKYEIGENFKSLEQCRIYAISRAGELGRKYKTNSDYICGLNCERKYGVVSVCKSLNR